MIYDFRINLQNPNDPAFVRLWRTTDGQAIPNAQSNPNYLIPNSTRTSDNTGKDQI